MKNKHIHNNCQEKYNKISLSRYLITILRKIFLTIELFSKNSIINHAASGAFYFLLSIVPLALFFVYVLDVWLSFDVKVSDYFFQFLSHINPQINKDFFINMGFLKGGSSIYGIVGIIGLIWSSRLVFSSINSAFNIIFKEDKKGNFFYNSAISLIFLPIIFVICVLFFGGSILLKQLNKAVLYLGLENVINISFIENLHVFYPFFTAIFISLILYRYIPIRKVSWLHGFISAVLFVISLYIIQKVTILFISFDKYYILYGIISALIVVLIWSYIIFALFYFFAVFIYVEERYTELEFVKWYSAIEKNSFLDLLIFSEPISAKSKYLIKFHKNDYIFLSGKNGGYIYFLLKGVVQLYSKDKFVEDIPVNSFFGESGISDKNKYYNSALCQVSGAGLKLPKDFYNRVVLIKPDISYSILNSVLARIT